MSEELEKLKSLGTQKIYEDTHIPVLHVQALLHNNFDSLSKVQFLGFVSILQREYKLDLSVLKAVGLAHFDDIDARNLDEGLFIAPTKKKSASGIYSLIAIVIFIVVVMYKSGVFTQDEAVQTVDDVLIQKVQKTIKPVEVVEDANVTQESNATQETAVAIEEVVEEEVEKVVESFKIRTKSKVWFGYIDVATNKKKQKTFRGEIDLDPSKKWLLIFGHGYIDMFINGEAVKMNSRENIRYLYEDATLRAISLKEFKKLNRGRKW